MLQNLIIPVIAGRIIVRVQIQAIIIRSEKPVPAVAQAAIALLLQDHTAVHQVLPPLVHTAAHPPRVQVTVLQAQDQVIAVRQAPVTVARAVQAHLAVPVLHIPADHQEVHPVQVDQAVQAPAVQVAVHVLHLQVVAPAGIESKLFKGSIFNYSTILGQVLLYKYLNFAIEYLLQ